MIKRDMRFSLNLVSKWKISIVKRIKTARLAYVEDK